MFNELGMAMQQAILVLKARGWSHRRIAREIGIHRETVGRYLSLAAKPASNPPAGSGTVSGDAEENGRTLECPHIRAASDDAASSAGRQESNR